MKGLNTNYIRHKYLSWIFISVALLVVLIVAVFISLTTGEIDITLFDLPKYLGKEGDSVIYSIINKIRIPRILLGLAVGGSLSLAGVILQGIYRNPLVEPYTLGISGGGALGVALVIVLGLHRTMGSFMLPLAGFIGALLTIVLVYSLSLRNGKIHIQSMLLIGVMISFIVSSAMMLLMAITTTENLHGIVFWIMGSLDEPDFNLIQVTLLISVVGLAVSYLFVQPLNALRLGEAKAKHLGINTEITIRILFILASLLTGMCVAVAGVIGFVGLIIPHLMRLAVGSDYRILLLSSFLGGGAFLIFSDLIARTIIAPNELPIGVITGIIGGTVFVIVLSRSNLKLK
ncbi:MAG: iron ABC transporter permease [Bacteroidales bacterium]